MKTFSFVMWIRLLIILGFVFVWPQRGDGREVNTFFMMGNGLLREGRLAEAIEALTEAIEIEPHNVEAYNNRALAYYEAKRIGEAEKDFLRAVQLNPNDAISNNNLGLFYYNQGDYDFALKYLERASAFVDKNDPHSADVYRNLRLVSAMLGMKPTDSQDQDHIIFETQDQDVNERGALSHRKKTSSHREYGHNIETYSVALKFYDNHPDGN